MQAETSYIREDQTHISSMSISRLYSLGDVFQILYQLLYSLLVDPHIVHRSRNRLEKSEVRPSIAYHRSIYTIYL